MSFGAKSIPFRVQPMWNTTAGWDADTVTVPEFGELVCEDTGAVPRFKCGDGVHTWSGLSYLFGGTGDYLGMAITSTVPPGGLTSDVYYFTVVTGTFTSLGGIVVPSTSLLSIISYDLGTTTWITSEIVDTGSIDLQSVLNSGNRALDVAILLQSTSNSKIQLDQVSGAITISDSTDNYIFALVNEGSAGFYFQVTFNGNACAFEFDNITSGVIWKMPEYRNGTLAYRGNGVAPTVAALAGAGVGATATVVGDDTSGSITLNLGTSPSSGNIDYISVTFYTVQPSIPRIILTPANGQAANQSSGTSQLFVDVASVTTSGFKITGGIAAISGISPYIFNYATIL